MGDTIDGLLREQALRHGSKAALIDPSERITYRELDLADPTTCSKSAARPCIPPRWSRRCAPSAGVTAAFVTNVPGAEGNRVGAVVVGGTATTAEALRRAARSVLSSFKVPTVWKVLDSEDAVPRSTTGNVDVAGLRELLGSG